MADLDPYSTVKPLFGRESVQSYYRKDDMKRIRSYQVYEAMYWSAPGTFKLTFRGGEDKPIYIPSARVIVETANRFLAKNFRVEFDPEFSSASARKAAQNAIDDWRRRENFDSKFASQKRFGQVRGDAVWHIIADDTKKLGSRVSIYEIDPASYFPIHHPDDKDKIIGCYIAELEIDPDTNRPLMRRQSYMKLYENAEEQTGEVIGIESELVLCDAAQWDERMDPATGKTTKANVVKTISPKQQLPDEITSIPVYHIKNFRTPGDDFGSAEMRGLESIAAAINQAVSDEELALALEGLGLYHTTSGPPLDDNGNEMDWPLGPGVVVEHEPETVFERIKGVDDIKPMQDHLKYLESHMKDASGISDAALGKLDVSIAPSGVSLTLQLAPLLSKNQEKEMEMVGIYNQMFYDLIHMWFPAFEEATPDKNLRPVCRVDENVLPVDREGLIREISMLMQTVPPIISAKFARQMLEDKIGIIFPDDIEKQIEEEQAVADPLGDMAGVAAGGSVEGLTPEQMDAIRNDPGDQGLISVEEFLDEQALSEEVKDSIRTALGRKVADLYRQVTGEEPRQENTGVDGSAKSFRYPSTAKPLFVVALREVMSEKGLNMDAPITTRNSK